LGAFTKLQKATISLVMSVQMELDIQYFSIICWKKNQVSLWADKKNVHFTRRQYVYLWQYL